MAVASVLSAVLAAGPGAGAVAGGGRAAFLGPLHRLTTVAATVPGNGDVNPYGVAVVPRTVGRLRRGDVLVSNFNDRANEQGTGRTIVEISPAGTRRVFARIAGRLPGRCPGGIGLTTALVVLRAGWVVVGSLPTRAGTAATARAGCLLVLDSAGRVRATIAGHGIDGPWDAAVADFGRRAELFVTNVLHGTVAAGGSVVDRGTVLRLSLLVGRHRLRVVGRRVVASRFAERTDPAALVIGPTGLAFDRRTGVLYVADTLRSRIAAIPAALTRRASAGTGRTVLAGGPLAGPLGLVTAPDGHLLAANGGNGNLVEVTPGGRVAAVRTLDRSGQPPGSGALFGLAVRPGRAGVYFVDDATNLLRLLS